MDDKNKKKVIDYCNQHFKEVNSLYSYQEEYFFGEPSKVLDFLIGGYGDRYLLTNNSIISRESYSEGFYNRYGWFDKQVIYEVFNSKHLLTRETRRPNTLIKPITISSYEFVDDNLTFKCPCIKERMPFEYIDSIELLSYENFWKQFNSSDISDEKMFSDNYFCSPSFLASDRGKMGLGNELIRDEKGIYVALKMVDLAEVIEKYLIHRNSMWFRTSWGKKWIGNVENGRYVIILNKEDANKLNKTFQEWKKDS